jgi:ankyrin repeat protein
MEKILQGQAGLSSIDAILLDPALEPQSVRAFRDANKMSLLALAARLQNLEALERLVKFFRASQEVVIEAGCYQSENLLLVALEGSAAPKGREILDFVLEEIGRDRKCLDVAFKRLAAEDRSALHRAAYIGRTEVFQKLHLLEGSDFKQRLINGEESRDKNQQTPLHLAASQGHGDTVRALMDIAPELSKVKDALGETSLHKAIGVQSINVVELLLDKDPALIKITNKKNKSPYRHALEIKEKARALNEIRRGSIHTVGSVGRIPSFDDRMETILKERTLRYPLVPDLSYHVIRTLFYGNGNWPVQHVDMRDLLLTV